MNLKFTHRDKFLLRLAAMIGSRATKCDFVALEKKIIKTVSSRIYPLVMFSELDTEIPEKFAFLSLSSFLSIIEEDPEYKLELDVKKHKSKVSACGKTYTAPVLIVNEYYDAKDLDPDQSGNEIYMNSAINSDKWILDEIARCKKDYIYKFKLSVEKIEEMIKDVKRIGAKVLNITGKDKVIDLKLMSDMKNDGAMTVEMDVEGDITGDIAVNIPFFPKILNGDMTFYACEHETVMIDETNNVSFITNSITDVEAQDGIIIDFDEIEFKL